MFVCLEQFKKENIKKKTNMSVSPAEGQPVALEANSKWECTCFPFIRCFAHRRGECFLWMSVMLMRQNKPTKPCKTCLNKRTFTVSRHLCPSLFPTMHLCLLKNTFFYLHPDLTVCVKNGQKHTNTQTHVDIFSLLGEELLPNSVSWLEFNNSHWV